MKKKLKEKLKELQIKIDESIQILIEIISIVEQNYEVKSFKTKTIVKNFKKHISILKKLFKIIDNLTSNLNNLNKKVDPTSLPYYIDKESDTVFVNMNSDIKYIFEE